VSHKSNRKVLNEAASVLAQSLRETEDELTREMLLSTASSVNCTNGTNGDVPTEITRTDIDDVIRALVNADAKKIGDTIQGQDRFGTGPVRESFFAMCSSQLISNLEQVDGFISVAQYPSQQNVLSSEWGSVSNLRFLTSSVGSVSENASGLGADVFNIFVTGLKELAGLKSSLIDLDLLAA